MSKSKTFPMFDWAKKLFPWHRSLSGQGTYDTLVFLSNINKNLKIKNFKSGTKCFDWVVPKEWIIKDAYLEHQSGKRFCEIKQNNLHIVQYSKPINKIINIKDLKKNIFYLNRRPKSIPYVTSYYRENWGFCMTFNQFKKLPKGNYKAYINSKLQKGKINYGEIVLKGKSKKEIFFSTYVCHPSMANNELSGPIVAIALSKYLSELNKKQLNYSYRFIFIPETIGAIAYINKELKKLKKNVICGVNLSCVGDGRAYSMISSRLGNTLADSALRASLKYKKNFKIYDYLERGSDERQFCSPGVNLPFCGFSRSKYYEYPEYHTSDDNLKIISQKNLEDSLDVVKDIVNVFEKKLYPRAKFICEPKMDKRNLYDPLSKDKNYLKKSLRNRMDFLSYADGEHTFFDIVNRCNFSLQEGHKIYDLLKYNKLIR
tara:strand:+ start:71 stop:1357 length:1287 start_codon:yes stop_codon:yes gene_type:complete